MSGLFLWMPLALGVCALPFSPGCGPDESRPGEDILVQMVLLTETTYGTSVVRDGASFVIDREGRSRFIGGSTVWALTPPSSCKTLPSSELQELQDAWREAIAAAGEMARTEPPPPYLVAIYYADDARKPLFLKPGREGEAPKLRRAVRETFRILEAAYGHRVRRELRASGLAELGPDESVR